MEAPTPDAKKANLQKQAEKYRDDGDSAMEVLSKLNRDNDHELGDPLPNHEISQIFRSLFPSIPQSADLEKSSPNPTAMSHIKPLPLFTSLKQLLECVRSPEWLIEGLMEIGVIIVLFGESGTYKTFLALCMALHVATGKSWFGRRVKQGAVYYVCGEGSGGFPRRVKAWLIHNQCEDAPFWTLKKEFFVNDKKAVAMFSEEILSLVRNSGMHPTLIVIDTLARCLEGDESKTEDMGEFIAGVSRFIRDFEGCSVLILHHCGLEATDRERGSSALRCAADVRIRISHNAKTKLEARLDFLKMKDGPEPDPLLVSLMPVELGLVDEAGHAVTSFVISKVTEAPIKSTQLVPQKDHALQILEKVIAEKGKPRPSVSGNIPCCTEEEWKQEFSKFASSRTKNLDSQMRSFRRARKALLGKGLIVAKKGYVWLFFNS